MAQSPKWYVIHTYSGYENKVATGIQKIVELRNLQDFIYDVKVPTEIVKETKDSGEVVEVERKLFPGYVLLNMILDDDTWILIKTIRGVTGFVGPGGEPIALTDAEVEALNFPSQTAKAPFEAGETVRIVNGPMTGFTGVVEDIDMKTGKARVIISMGGREVPTEMDVDALKAM